MDLENFNGYRQESACYCQKMSMSYDVHCCPQTQNAVLDATVLYRDGYAGTSHHEYEMASSIESIGFRLFFGLEWKRVAET